jgi:hypothetical protein
MNECGNIGRLAAENSVVSRGHDPMVPSAKINCCLETLSAPGGLARSPIERSRKKREELAC